MTSAVLSPCGSFRFELRRRVSPDPRPVCWVMFNPSTADAETDDPTIRRCMDLTRRWGYGHLVVVNLSPLRSPNPEDALRRHGDPRLAAVYSENRRYLERAVQAADLVVAAWGSAAANGTGDHWRERLRQMRHDVMCLGLTASRQPRHPLYVRADTPLLPLPA